MPRHSLGHLIFPQLLFCQIAHELQENATTSDVISVSGSISVEADGVVFTGSALFPVDSPVTAQTIMEILSNHAATGPLSDGQSTLDLNPSKSI